MHVSCDTLARASAFRVFLTDYLFVCLYGMCCEFSAISFSEGAPLNFYDMFWVQFLLFVAWCFLFPDVLLLILLPCTVLIFDSFTLYLYICNNNYLTTELVLFFHFTFLFNKCFRQSQRLGNFEAVLLLVLQITLASQF